MRNPSDKAQDFHLNLKDALELPAGAASSFIVDQPFAQQQPALHWQADRVVSLHLKPFEVETFESEIAAVTP